MQANYSSDWTDALGTDIATMERARRVAVQAAEAIYATDSTELSRSLLIVGYCGDLDELLADTLRLATVDSNGSTNCNFSCI